MYISYNHLNSIKKAYQNLNSHLVEYQKEEIRHVLHQSIGHINTIDPSFSPYAELFKEDF
jgi:hypothetical protein